MKKLIIIGFTSIKVSFKYSFHERERSGDGKVMNKAG